MLAEPAPQPKRSALRFGDEQLVGLTVGLLEALRTPRRQAEQVARALVLANLLGHDSHGIMRLGQYAAGVRSGQVVPDAEASVTSSRLATGVVDGAWGFGQPAAQLATGLAIELASSAGIAAVTITRCNHIGRVGEYVASIAAAGKMGLALCNSGPCVAPYGGGGRVMGTNPLAWSVPLPGGDVVLDFATSNLAEGKIRLAKADGREVPAGSIVDKAGNPSLRPADFYEGGALLPFGSYKGSGLSMMIELSAALLSGMGSSCDPDYGGGNGTLIMALDIAAFGPLESYEQQAATFCRLAKEIGPGPLGGEVLLPGEPERRTGADRRANGIPVSDAVRRDLTGLADGLGVELGAFAMR